MSIEEASALVQRFLRLMEARDLTAAEALVAPDAPIVFPGGRRFKSQRDMVAAAGGRYQWVKKTFDQIDALADGRAVVVYVLGTLYGVNAHGVRFEGVRFVDRFVVQDDRIIRQEVWNDLAESGVLAVTRP